MQLAADVVTALIGALHVYILVLEMFLWSRAVRVFAVPKEDRDNERIRVLFQNQGIYNGFLAAGLFWGLAHPDPAFGMQLKLFFLGCVAVAGVVGAVTAKPQILMIQTVPAALGIALVLFAG
jgi:putative membrane protein